MKDVEALDNKWEEVKLASANMEALKGQDGGHRYNQPIRKNRRRAKSYG